MSYIRKDIPPKLLIEIEKWCINTFDKINKHWSFENSGSGHLYEINFEREKDYMWFMLKWENTIQNYHGNTTFTFPAPDKMRPGDLLFVTVNGKTQLHKVTSTYGNTFETENA